MKKLLIVMLMGGMLAGCGAQPVFETLGAIPVQGQMAEAQQVLMELPGDLLAPVMESDSGQLYVGDGYTVTVQTLPGGDLDRTVRSCTGFAARELTVLCIGSDGVKRYDMAWSTAGETGQQTCRAVLLDDGSHHYVLTCMADAEIAGALATKWQRLFDTFRLESMPTPLSIGS